MNKYSGLNSTDEGVTTANQDLYALAKTNEGWTTYTPWYKFSFIPTTDCTVKINGGATAIVAKANVPMSDADTQITSFIVVESGIAYALMFRY